MIQLETQGNTQATDDDAVTLMRHFTHDLRSVMNVITATNDMALEGVYGELSPTNSRAAERIKRNSARLLIIVDHFMLYVKAMAGPIESPPVDLAPLALVEAVQKPVRDVLEQNGVRFHVDVAPEVPLRVHAHEYLWRLMFEALCWNAVAFTETGAIHLGVELEKQGMLHVDVRDSGLGISPEIQGQLYTPFCRGLSPRIPVPTSGSGLGLAMAHAVASRLGGQLALITTGAEGSHFQLRLPCG